jgi:hypothetical protein
MSARRFLQKANNKLRLAVEVELEDKKIFFTKQASCFGLGSKQLKSFEVVEEKEIKVRSKSSAVTGNIDKATFEGRSMIRHASDVRCLKSKEVLRAIARILRYNKTLRT